MKFLKILVVVCWINFLAFVVEVKGYENPCIGNSYGYFCIAGVSDSFYECSLTFEGWRKCSNGATCTNTGRHSFNPCVTKGSPGNESWIPTSQSAAEESKDTTIGWEIWLAIAIGVVVSLTVLGLISFLVIKKMVKKHKKSQEINRV